MSESTSVVERWRRFVAARLDRKAQVGLYLTIVLAIGASAIWLFGALLDAVLDNATLVRLDLATDAAIRGQVTPGGLQFFSIVTHLGDPITVAAVALIGAVLLWRTRGHMLLVMWIAAFAGAGILERSLKLAVHRSRPTRGAHYLNGTSFSFPSGHSLGIVVAVCMILYALFHTKRPSRTARAVLTSAGAVIVLLVGASRVYLGVHYPSDVIGGYAAAAGWVAACVSLATVSDWRAKRV